MRDGHGFFCRISEPSESLLLKKTGNKRRRRVLSGSFLRTFRTLKGRPSISEMTPRVCSWVFSSVFSPLQAKNLASKGGGSSAFKWAVRDQYSRDSNAWISRSRSHIILTATDCTRPALNPRFTFFQKVVRSDSRPGGPGCVLSL